MEGETGAAHALSDGCPASATQRSGQERSFTYKMSFCRQTASLSLEASCQGPGSRHLRRRYQQRQPGRQTRSTSSSGAQQPADQTALHHLGAHSAPLPAEVEAKKAVPKSEEAERMRQLSGNTTRTRKVFVGGLPPSVDETAFRWGVAHRTEGRRQPLPVNPAAVLALIQAPHGDLWAAWHITWMRQGCDHALPAAGSTLNSLERWRRRW